MTDHSNNAQQVWATWGLDYAYWSDPEHVYYHDQIAHHVGQLLDALSAGTVVFDNAETYRALWHLEGILMGIGLREVQP